MRCNQNCSCNRNNFSNGGNFQPFNNQAFYGNSQFNRSFSNECNVFAAVTSDAQTVTGTAATSLALNNILYDYGNAIRATSGGSSIYITQPGLYQVSYFIEATNTGTTDSTVTAYILRNSTQIATTTSTAIAAGDSAVLADTEIFYVSCQDLPVTLTLTTTSTGTTTTYTYFITVNRICSCDGNFTGFGGTDDTTAFTGNFIGCDSSFGQPIGGPGPVIPNGGFNGGFNGGCNSGCNSGRCN